MKKVLFDLYSAQPQGNVKFHGGGEYIKQLFSFLVTTCNGDYNLVVFYNENVFLGEPILKLISDYGIQKILVKKKEDIQYMLNTSGKECDVFFSGLISLYKDVIFPTGMTVVGTIHGLRELEVEYDSYARYYYPTHVFLKKMMGSLFFKKTLAQKRISRINELAQKFDTIITDSKHSEYAIRTWLDLRNTKRVGMAYPPPLPAKSIDEDDDKMVRDLPPYALLISADRYEKNACRALEAFDRLFSKNKATGLNVVVCGRIPARYKKRIINNTRIIEYGYVSESLLQALYKHCDFFMYPSINEGFGYPPIEAMRYGKTCVCSAVCSVPEVCGDAVYYINPYDIAEMENRILQAYDNKKNYFEVQQHYTELVRRQEDGQRIIKELILTDGK